MDRGKKYYREEEKKICLFGRIGIESHRVIVNKVYI